MRLAGPASRVPRVSRRVVNQVIPRRLPVVLGGKRLGTALCGAWQVQAADRYNERLSYPERARESSGFHRNNGRLSPKPAGPGLRSRAPAHPRIMG